MAGTIRRRGESWQLLVRHQGKQYSKTIRGGSKRAAERELASYVTEVTTGRVGTSTAETVGELLHIYVDFNRENWSPYTLRFMPGLIDRLEPLHKIRLSRLTTADIDACYLKLARERKLGAASIHRTHTVLRAALGLARRWRWIGSNPAEDAKLPSLVADKIEPPSPDDVRLLLAHAAVVDPDLAVFVRLAAATGARRGELCALRWSDIHGRVIVLDQAIADAGGGELVVKSTKSGRARRVSVDEATASLLALRRAARERVGEFDPDSFVFSYDVLPGFKPWRPDRVSDRFLELRRSTDAAVRLVAWLATGTSPPPRRAILNARLHDLRHWTATHAQQVASPVDGASRLGHSRTSTFTDMYAAPLDEKDAVIADHLGRLLDGDPSTYRAVTGTENINH